MPGTMKTFVMTRIGEVFGVHAQDQWTMSRLSLQGAVRYERASSFSG